MSKKLYKSKSNFTLKRLHQSGSYGNIYERDYTTIVPSISTPGGQIPIYGSPSFKLTTSNVLNKQKKYNYGNWLGNGTGNTWTLNNIPEPNKKSSKILLKPHTRRLTDFACYGSAYELIKTSITNIISNFPAELYVSNQTIKESGILEILKEDCYLRKEYYEISDDYVFIDNPFNIDLLQNEIPEDSTVSPLRYINVSFEKYEIIKDENKIDISNWEVSAVTSEKECLEDGDLIASINIDGKDFDDIANIFCFYYADKIIYICNKNLIDYRIRPKEEYIEEFFNNLNDFEKVLLNRETGYSSKFETYYEDEEKGWVVSENTYKWLTSSGDWNLSLKGIGYNSYIESLSNLALGYDELYTNTIWRDMTHESISNMDSTINLEDSDISTGKIKQTLNIIGRQFDEIKKYIDNIKNTNSITYDQNQNAPDYFLSDNLNLTGFEVKDILNDIPDNIKTNTLYNSRKIGFSASDANSEFMRRLSLNSKSILSKKGTKQSIEELMAIFGFHSTDWLKSYYGGLPHEMCRKAFIIDEYVDNITDYSGFSNNIDKKEYPYIIQQLNAKKDTFSNEDSNNPDGVIDEYQGIAVAEVMNYIVPWFDKNKKYDNDIYFQNNGGWGKKTHYECYEEIEINNTKNLIITEINSTTLPNYKVSEYIKFNDKYYQWIRTVLTGDTYERTISKINYVTNKEELYTLLYSTLKNGDIYYVEEDKKYYILNDVDNFNYGSGWTETSNVTEEKIIESNKGNNPHSGDYDSGKKYQDFIRYPLSGVSACYVALNETPANISNTFNVDEIPTTKYGRYDYLVKDGIYYMWVETNNLGFNMTVDNIDSLKVKQYINNFNNYENLRIRNFNSETEPRNLFDDTNIENTSFSILNNKRLNIIFDAAHMEFIEKDILPYLKQIIPSTTIFTYGFEHIDGLEPELVQEYGSICNERICPVFSVTE